MREPSAGQCPRRSSTTPAELGEERLAALLALVVTINAWNAIGVATRCWGVHRDAA
jgi:hypothetical protein